MDAAVLFDQFKKYHESEDLVEEVIQRFYSSFLSPDKSHAIDCGCHKGYHTEPLSRVCKTVVGIDANSEMCDFLISQLKQQNVVNCKIVHAAVQNDPQLKSVTFYISDNFLGRSSLTRLWDVIDKSVSYRPITAPATTIDQLMITFQLDKVDFIKLDLEGGEYMALKGAEILLRRDQPALVMENSVHAADQGGFLKTDPFDYLTGLGYVLMSPNGNIVTRDNLFPFFYLFAVPAVRFDELRGHLIKAYLEICKSHNLI